LNLNIVVRFSN